MAKHLTQQIGVAVDIVVFTVEAGRLSVLLTAVKRPPYEGRWALPGGLIGLKETLDQAAARELQEKTGLRDVYTEQLYTFSAPRRDPAGRVVAVAYLALVPAHGVALRATEKYAGIGWFPTVKLPALAFDHGEMVRYAVQRLRYKLEYTNVAYSLLAESFTLSELQGVYEVILGRALDPRNFRKRILTARLEGANTVSEVPQSAARLGRPESSRRASILRSRSSVGLIEPTGEERRGGAHRPASLYRFTAREPRVVEIL